MTQYSKKGNGTGLPQALSLICVIVPSPHKRFSGPVFSTHRCQLIRAVPCAYFTFYPRNSDLFTGLGMPTSIPREAKLPLLRLH